MRKFNWLTAPLWRGSLLPLGRAAALKPDSAISPEDRIGAATQPSGSKLPRHSKLAPTSPV